ncbi:putative recombination initiation defects 3 [Cornus florida]|uniref:putative recombination initiation defects 3 n=1 Tax=Cornus florida TaxID=4283 RepID=UPI0028A20C63|nr:putative recombination initiation defects 3 [Cornus florida]
MKLKINKASDLSSISVLPPPPRRASTVPNGPECSVFGKSQTSQLRSQPSQQSFSQGVSSQYGMFSQLSQNSLDEIAMNDQRFGSQERENSVKKISCLPPISCAREDSQMPISRSSTNLMCKWNSAPVADLRYQISEELEHRIGMMQTSINKFGMILESIQSDIMQINRGTKDVSVVVEGIRQKLIVHDHSLQLLDKREEDIKTTLDGGFKSISDQLIQDIYQERLQEISSMLSALPEQIDACLQKLKYDICRSFSQEMQVIASVKIPNKKHLTPNQKRLTPTAVLPRGISYCATSQQMSPFKNPVVHPKVRGQATLGPKVEVGSWTTVKQERSNFTYRCSNKEQKQKEVSPAELERERRVAIESDEEIDGFSCLLEEKETGLEKYSMAEVKEETLRILRKARRRKRKYCNHIIID